MNDITRLREAVAAVCPVHGVAIGRRKENASCLFHAKPEATTAERREAQRVIDAFEWRRPRELSSIKTDYDALAQSDRDTLRTAILDGLAIGRIQADPSWARGLGVTIDGDETDP